MIRFLHYFPTLYWLVDVGCVLLATCGSKCWNQVLTMTGFVTILRRVPTLTLRHSSMMLSHLLGVILGFFVLGEHGSGGWFPNWNRVNNDDELTNRRRAHEAPHLMFLQWGSADSHLIFHPSSPRYRDLHVDVFEELGAQILLLRGALHRGLHSASGGRRRGVSGVCRSRGNVVQPVGASRAGVVGLLLFVTGQDDWRGTSNRFYEFLPECWPVIKKNSTWIQK